MTRTGSASPARCAPQRPTNPRRTPDDLTTGLSHATAEILHELLPHRRLRANPRVVRAKMSNYNLKRPEHRSWPQPTYTIEEVIRIIGA